MAYQLNGVDQYIEFGVGALSAVLAGPTTMAVCVNLDATTDGAAIHLLTSGNASGAFLECFGSWDYGIGATARVGPAGVTGSWRIIVFSKATGTASVEWTQIIIGGATTSGTATGGTLTDGSTPPGGTGKIRVGRFQNSATEYVNGKIAACAVFTSALNQAQREALTTWAAWQSAGFAWGVEMQSLSTLTDASGGGGNETGRFGTAGITLVADPAGFFSSASDVIANAPAGTGVQVGSSPAVAVADVIAVAPAGSGVQTGSSGAVAAVEAVAPAGSGVQVGGSGVVTSVDALAPAGSGVQLGGSPSVVAVDSVAPAGSGVQVGGSDASAFSVVIATDPGAPGVQLGSSPAVAVADVLAVPDAGPGVQVGGSPAAVVADVLAVAPAGTGVQVGGSPPSPLVDTVAVAPSGPGVQVGGSPAAAFEPADVVAVAPNAPGVTVGGSPATAGTDEVVHDQMVMPVLDKALTCLQAELAKVAQPPTHYQVRPGATFTAMADNENDECCAGIAWVRPGPMFPSVSFPEPANEPTRNPIPYWAATVELGVMRCMDTVSNEVPGDKMVTALQWREMTQRAMDDAAALRRAICCLWEQYGGDAIIVGQITPLENEGNCGGQTVVLTIRVPACDCVE